MHVDYDSQRRTPKASARWYAEVCRTGCVPGTERLAVTTVNPPRAATLDEVARVAGVSRATASRAINGGSRVSERSLRAVQEAVRSLGYVPNRAARTLVTRRTDSVAVVVPEPDERVFNDPFFAGTLRAVARVLGEREVQLVLLLAAARAHRRSGCCATSPTATSTGRSSISHHRDDHLPELMPSLGLPVVFGGRPWSGSDRVPYVDVDNVAGGRLATERLVAARLPPHRHHRRAAPT